MERLTLLVCLGLICAASANNTVDPRGTRPVEHGTRSEKCASQKEWPFCTSDEWGPKCPSGCRIQGLMDKDDHDLLKRIEKIRSLLDQNKANYRSTDHTTKQTFDYLKDKLVTDSDNDNKYFDLAQSLRQRITDMKIKIDRQLRILAALKDRVKDQVVEMERLEVDIDIKLRACKGSCQSYTEYNVDKDSYVALSKQIDQLDSHSAQSIESVGTMYVMKSRRLQDSTVDSIYKSGDTPGLAAQQTEDVFSEVNTVRLTLETEGSSTSPATVSKDPGTSLSPSTSSSSSSSSSPSTSSFPSSSSTSSSSSSSSTSSSSITELGGHTDLFGGPGFDGFSQSGTGHVSTQHIACTKTIRRTVVHTKDGPVERVEEVMGGGPECQSMTNLNGGGGMSSIFPSLTQASSSSSTTRTVHHTGSTKGSLFGNTKSGLGDPFEHDFGGFLTDAADVDVPDFHARSLKNTRVERQADYVGKGTETSDQE